MNDGDIDGQNVEHQKRSIISQLLESLPTLTGLGIVLHDDDNVFSVLCHPCHKTLSYSNKTKLGNLQEHVNGKNHMKQLTNTSTNLENWIDPKQWEKVSLDANGFLMFQCETFGITTNNPSFESIEEQNKVLLRDSSPVVSVNLSEILVANTIAPLKIGYLCYACTTILNPTPTWEIIISHLKSTKHTKKLLKWNATHVQEKLLDIPSHLTPLISENFLQHKEKEIYCFPCSAHLQSFQSLIDHTNSKNHMAKLNSFMQTILVGTILELEEDSTSKDVQPSLLTATHCTSTFKSMKTQESTDLKPKLEQTSDELDLLKKNHYISGKRLHCKICRVDLKNLGNIFSHIKGKNHEAQLREIKIKLKEKSEEAAKNSLKLTIECSISDQPERMAIPDIFKPLISYHLLQHLEKEIYCTACSAHLQSVQCLINHTDSKNHTKKLNLLMQNISTANISDLEQDLTSKDSQPSLLSEASCTLPLKSVKTQEFTDLKPKLEQTSDELDLLKKIHYISGKSLYCKICSVHLESLPNISSHINGKKHKTRLREFEIKLQENLAKSPNKSNRTEAINASTDAYDESLTASKVSENLFLQSIERRIIDMNPISRLMNTQHDQKCLQQERFLLDRPKSSLDNDIHATVPISTSPAFTTAMTTASTSALISTSLAASSIPSLCNSSTKDAISDQSNLMVIPDELKPLISKHFLQHLETEIYCVMCSAHLQNTESLLAHTKSKHHKLRLNDKMKYNKLKSKLNIFEDKLRQSRYLTSTHFLHATDMPLKESNVIKDSRKTDSMYSSIDINEIYKMNPEKLRIIEMSCQLCFPKSLESLYCLICEKSISNNVQNFYEHMLSDLHTRYFAELETNDLLYVDHPNRFSNLTLLQEFIYELTDDTLQCLICDRLILDLDADILEHIKQQKHIMEKRRLNKLSEETFLKTVLQHAACSHDNINLYWCELCDFTSKSAVAFVKHSRDPTDNICLEERSSDECNLIYDSCVPCASLWLGSMNAYVHHCKTKSHKNITLAYQIIKEMTLPPEAIIYLKHAVQKVEDLIQLSDQVMTKEQCRVDNLLKCLEKTVEPVFPKATAYPFGSRMSGLGFPESDIDVFLDCGNYFGTTVSEKEQQRLIDAVISCIHRDKKSWKIEEVLTGGRIPLIILYHHSTQLKCDISFKNGLSVENTKLLKCFVTNCPVLRRLILFLKKWLSICNLSGTHYITNYALCWYAIFYLQSKTILPSVADLIHQGNNSKIVGGWETGICEKFVPRMHDESFLSLLHGFFKYYAIFNFCKCVACPLLGYTVYKDDFEDLFSLPLEMAPYINQLKVSIDHRQMFRIDSPMCIQDPYDLAHNLTKAVSKFDLAIFKHFCEAGAEVLNSDFKIS